MSKTPKIDDLFTILSDYERDIRRLQRSVSAPHVTPIEFAGSGNSADVRLRWNDSNIVVERLEDGNWVNIGTAGGGGGPPGDPAGGASDLRFVQGVPSATWVIDWPEGRVVPPNVTVVVDGEQVIGDLTYNEALKRVTVTFDAPISGVAYLT